MNNLDPKWKLLVFKQVLEYTIKTVYNCSRKYSVNYTRVVYNNSSCESSVHHNHNGDFRDNLSVNSYKRYY